MSDLLLYIKYPTWLHPEIFPNIPWLSFLRWYSLSYIIGFFGARKILPFFLRNRQGTCLFNKDEIDSIMFTVMISMIIGGRLGYVFIYDPAYYFSSFQNFLSIFLPFRLTKNPESGFQFSFTGIAGLSYHGALIGIVSGGLINYLKYRNKISFFGIPDMLAPLATFLYTFGRLGNFANQELYGKVTASPLGVLFPKADPIIRVDWAQKIAESTVLLSSPNNSEFQSPFMINLPRHPSQLYEAFFEGLFLGTILLLMVIHVKKLIPGLVFSTYFFGYGLVRFLIEYVREPDSNIGFLIKLGKGSENPEIFTSFLNFSLGQVMCSIMMLVGLSTALFVSIKHNFYSKQRSSPLPP